MTSTPRETQVVRVPWRLRAAGGRLRSRASPRPWHFEETPEAYEGLGIAARSELDADAAFAGHERGYHLARAEDDDATAARLAIGWPPGASSSCGWTKHAG